MGTSRKKSVIIISTLLLVVIGFFILKPILLDSSKKAAPKAEDSITMEPQFFKEGVLIFFNNEQDTIKMVDIEIADNEPERTQGMMYRTSMPYDQAMLFIMEYERPQSFWMHNTKMSLDIMYVNGEMEIVTIYKHTQPYSKSPIPSFEKAKYVVETSAGFCDKYGVKKGDRIKFDRIG